MEKPWHYKRKTNRRVRSDKGQKHEKRTIKFELPEGWSLADFAAMAQDVRHS